MMTGFSLPSSFFLFNWTARSAMRTNDEMGDEDSDGKVREEEGLTAWWQVSLCLLPFLKNLIGF